MRSRFVEHEDLTNLVHMLMEHNSFRPFESQCVYIALLLFMYCLMCVGEYNPLSYPPIHMQNAGTAPDAVMVELPSDIGSITQRLLKMTNALRRELQKMRKYREAVLGTDTMLAVHHALGSFEDAAAASLAAQV